MTPREEFVEAIKWLWEDHVETGYGDEDHSPETMRATPCGVMMNLRALAVAFAENTHQPANCCGMACAEKRFPVRRFLRECGLEETP